MTSDSSGGFEPIDCLEGSTLRDPITGQPMHSAIGPLKEAQQIYLEPSRLKQRLATSDPHPLVLWDVGMGIAANAVAALNLARNIPECRPLEIHSFENELRGIETALQDLARFEHLRSLAQACVQLLSTGRAQLGPHHWILHPGDFWQAHRMAPAAEVIFYDFYSPRVCGALWSAPLLALVRSRSPQAMLVTYSAATPVRLALLLSGWWVGRPNAGLPVTQLKNESTIAWAEPSLIGADDAPLTPDWLVKFRSSTQARPYDSKLGPGQDPWTHAAFDELESQLLKHPQFTPFKR